MTACQHDDLLGPSASRTPSALPSFTISSASGPYQAIELGRDGESAAEVYGINAAGDAVGRIGTNPAKWPANATAPVRLESLPGSSTGDCAVAINSHGDIVGWAETQQGFVRVAVIWPAGGTPRVLESPVQGATNTTALGINDAGDVVGYTSVSGNGPYTAVVWKHGGAGTILPDNTGGGARATAINNRGDIVGSVYTARTQDAYGIPRPALWPASGGVVTLNANSGFAWAINDAGVIVGSLNEDAGDVAMIWWNDASRSSRTLQPLPGATSTIPTAINLSNDVVGTSGGHPVIWPAADLPRALPEIAGITGEGPTGVNASGQVVGFGRDSVYESRGIRWVQGAQTSGKPTVSPTITSSIPASNGWYRSDVTVAWTVNGASSSNSCPTTTISADTPQNGRVITCSATNSVGTTTETVTIKRDATKPVVSYSPGRRKFSVDQMVSIDCSAHDALSGIATSTCTPIKSGAYLFNVGDNTQSATVTDNAGNVATASVTFEVTLNAASLCKLTKQWVAGGASKDLCKELDKKEWSSFTHDVGQTSGLTSSQAKILTDLANVLAK